MQICQNCGNQSLAGFNNCSRCGKPLTNEADKDPALSGLSNFIPATLDEKIKAATATISGQRRLVTVLVVNGRFPITSHTVDEEAKYLLEREIVQLFSRVVEEYEGYIDQISGLEMRVLFGTPTMVEDHAERAIRTALALQNKIKEHDIESIKKFQVYPEIRFGINTGHIVVGTLGSNVHKGYTVVGNTVKNATVLAQSAVPGAILVSESTHQLTKPIFDFQLISQVESENYSNTVSSYEPVAIRQKPGRVRGLPGMQVPMIGRKEAIEELIYSYEAVCRSNQEQVVLITGEAGVGKSRLLLEFRNSLNESDFSNMVTIYEGNCLAHTFSRPYWIIASMLRHIADISEDHSPETQLEHLTAYLESLELNLNNVQPFLVYLLGLEQASPMTQQRIRLYDADMLQKLIHNAVRRVFRTAASHAPLILIFEDLHWGDAASWALLNYLAISAEKMPILLILTSRELHSDQFAKSTISFTRLNLQVLSFEESKMLAHQIINQSSDVAEVLKLKIAERAAGNPFYLEELIRMLIDAEGIIVEDGNWQVTAKADSLLQEVPGTLQALILARFDSLDVHFQQVLQKAAVLGISFSAELLRMLDNIPMETINNQLQHLVSQQFLIDASTSRKNVYAFQHSLVQDAIYGTLLRRQRQRLHGRVTQALENNSDWFSTERDQLLAYHYNYSRSPEKAIPYLLKIADDAARRFANETAVQYYAQAETLIDKHVTGYDEVYFKTKIGLGQTLKFLGNYDKAGILLSTALQALLRWSMEAKPVSLLTVMINGLREIADIEMRKAKFDSAIAYLEAGLESLGDNGFKSYPVLYRSLMERTVFILFRQGKLDEAFDLAQSAITNININSQSIPDPVNLANIYNSLGGISWQQGNLESAINYVNQSLKIYETLDYAWGTANVYNNLGILTAQKGDWFQAIDYWERALALRKEIGDLQNQTLNLLNLGQLRLQMGKFSDARADLENALTILHKLDDSFGIANAVSILAHIALIEQDYDLAKQHIQISIELADAVGAHEIQVDARWIKAQILLEREEFQESLETVSAGLKMAKDIGIMDAESDCLRTLGKLHLKMGNFVVAETHFRESIELSLQINNPYRQGLALLEMGRIYQTMFEFEYEQPADWHSRSQVALIEAVDIFTSLGADYDKRKAADALRFLELNPPQFKPPNEMLGAGMPQDGSFGERHTAAFLLLNLALPADADEETVFEIMTFVLPACATIAQEYNGHVKQLSQGLMVAFGVPTTYEDDLERAVRAAHHILQYLQQPEVQDEFALSVQIAVSGGDVIAGQVVQRGQADIIFRGEPVEQAQQAVTAVPPNQVWVTDAVRKATERLYTYHSKPQLHVIPQPLWQLVDLRETPDPARGMPGVQTRFVGRDSSLQAMLALKQNLDQGFGGIIWIEGEAGIGKSRLMREFKTAIATENMLIWEGGCSPQRVNQAFSLFTDILFPVFNLQPNDSSEQIRRKIEQTVSAWPNDARATQPYMEVLAGIRPLGLSGEILNRLEPEQLRQQVFVAVRRLIKSLARRQPLIMVLDDLHWIDPISAELLLFMVTAVTAAPIMFVCAQRREGSDSPNDRLIRLQSLMPGQTLRLLLDRLPAEVSQLLLDDLLPGAELPDEFRQILIARSEGNPYFIEEFVRMFIEQGYVTSSSEKNWQVSTQLNYDTISIPSSLETLIRSRVDALPNDLKQTIQSASIIGREFEVTLLATIMNTPHIRMQVERLAQRLMFTPGSDSNQWQFSHALYEAVVYNSMLKTHQQTLHRNVAEALENLWANAESNHAKELAYHYMKAGEQIKALPYLVEAGEQATGQQSGEEALSHFQKAAEFIAQTSHPDDDLQLRIAIGLGEIYRLLGKYDKSLAAFAAGLPVAQSAQEYRGKLAELYRRMGDTARRQGNFEAGQNYFSMSQELIGEPENSQLTLEMAQILIGQAWIHFVQGQFDETSKAAKASLEYAKAIDNLSELAAAHNLLGGVHYHLGEWRDAFHHTTRAMVLWEQMGYSWGVAGALSNLGILAFAAGHWHKAISFFERSLALRNEMGDVEGIAITQNNLGSAYRGQGKFEQAERFFQESVETAKTYNITYHVANSSAGWAHAILAQGRVDEAQAIIEKSIETAEALGAQDVLAEAHRIRAEILLAYAEPQKALEAARQAALLAESGGDRSFEAAAWRIAAESALNLDDFDSAKELIQKAEISLEGAMDDLEMGHVAAQAYRVYSLAGDHEQATEKLRIAREIFNRLGLSYFLNQLGQVEAD